MIQADVKLDTLEVLLPDADYHDLEEVQGTDVGSGP